MISYSLVLNILIGFKIDLILFGLVINSLETVGASLLVMSSLVHFRKRDD